MSNFSTENGGVNGKIDRDAPADIEKFVSWGVLLVIGRNENFISWGIVFRGRANICSLSRIFQNPSPVHLFGKISDNKIFLKSVTVEKMLRKLPHKSIFCFKWSSYTTKAKRRFRAYFRSISAIKNFLKKSKKFLKKY